MTRTKSFPVRSSRKSLDPNPSLPVEILGSSGVSNTQCEANDGNVQDTFGERRDVPHKKRHCLGTGETRGGVSDPLNLDACFVCDISDQWVSRCSGIDCPLSFHGECVNANAEFPNPYCPYCWFKILALKSKSLREKVVVAEKAVFKYLDKEMKSRDGVMDTTSPGDVNGLQEQVDKDSDQSRPENMPLIEDRGMLEVGTDPSEDKVVDEVQASAEDDGLSKVNTYAREKGDISQFLSTQETFSGKEHKQNEKQRRRRVILNATDSEISLSEQNGDDVTEQITSSAQVTSSPSGQRKPNATTKVAKSKTVRDISFFNKDQRRRLLWTTEEEEMLKVGVEKFAAEANKNMPWRKILEMGEKVFHETRTPTDLKDKWRNMNKKTTH